MDPHDIHVQDIHVARSGYVELKKINDGHDGNLCVLEQNRDVPFEVKRIYYINNLENCVSIRGKHAHHELEQVIFCINGSFVLKLDDGETQQEILMYRDHVGVVLGRLLWHEMHSFSTGCVLLVAASDYYDESDYIRSYDDFLQCARDH
ncbi:MAG: sugar 3,4-ketoisomerase [Lentisphaeria bacterium]